MIFGRILTKNNEKRRWNSKIRIQNPKSFGSKTFFFSTRGMFLKLNRHLERRSGLVDSK